MHSTIKNLLKILHLDDFLSYQLFHRKKLLVFNKIDQLIDLRTASSSVVPSTKKKVGIVPGSSPGSLGDEAMVRSLCDHLENTGCVVVPIALFPGDEWSFMKTPEGSIPRSIEQWTSFIDILATYDWIYINGADVMDGKYGVENSLIRLALAYAASKLGIGVTITGFSINKTCPKVIVEGFRLLPNNVSLCLRDPDSKQRLGNALKHELIQVADLAFLMKPDEQGLEKAHYKKWIDSCKKNEKKILAINICYLVLNDLEASNMQEKVQFLLDSYVDALRHFLSKHPDYCVLMVPHDYRGLHNDLNLSLLVKNLLVSKFGFDGRVEVVDDRCNAAVIKAVALNANIAFSGRMHFAIACIGVGTPVACLTYQDKFEGLFKLSGLDVELLADINFSTENLIEPLLEKLCANESKYRNQISENLPQIKKLSAKNF